MKIAFVQEELFPYFGFMYLAAIAKNLQHEVEVFVYDDCDGSINSIINYKPTIIGFTATSPNYGFVKNTANKLKKLLPDSFIIVGGWHPTFQPDILDDENCFDAICLGEGEIPFKMFLESYPDCELIKKIPSLHVKINGRTYKNPMMKLIDNLDNNIFPDRSLYYDKFEILRKTKTKTFFAGRGCPYPCSYCFNEPMKEKYKNKGKYVRLRSPENIIEEIKRVKQDYPLEYVQFQDDTFTSNKQWLLNFLDFYRKNVDIPLLFSCRIENLDDLVVGKMKQAGVDRVGFAIEHGNEDFRRKVLGRNVSNQRIIDGSKLLRKYNIRYHVSNMIGLPGESFDMSLETLKLNQLIKPDLPYVSLFQPYVGTKLIQYAVDQGYLDEDFKDKNITGHLSWGAKDTSINSLMHSDDMNKMINLQMWFPFLVNHPNYLFLIKPLLSLKPKKCFGAVTAFYFLKNRVKYASSMSEIINYTLQFTGFFFPKVVQKMCEKIFSAEKMT